jgi:hypothetical protein
MITPDEWGAALKPPISGRRVRVLCEEGRVKGAKKFGEGIRCLWMIPKDAPDPRKPAGRPPRMPSKEE